MKKILTLVFAIYANIAIAQEAVLLRLNYEEGATYKVAMKTTQEMGTVMSMGMTLDMDIKVTAVQEASYDSEMKFTKMTMDIMQGNNFMSYDSSKPDADLDDASKMMKAQMQPMLDALIYAKGNNLGELTAVKIEPNVMGMEEIAKQSSNIIYPENAVKVGDSWSTAKEDKGMKMNVVYTVKSITKALVVLTLSGDISGMANGKITGEMNIDTVSGVPLNSTLNMNMTVGGQEMKSSVSMEMNKV
jgi:hypothetical protein